MRERLARPWAQVVAPPTVWCLAFPLVIPRPCSAPNHVDHGENNHPHGVHKMPVKGQNIDALGVLLSYIAKQGSQQYRCHSPHAYRDVEGMQTNERIVGGSEQVGLNRKTFVVDQVAPLKSCAGEKQRSEGECQRPPQCEGTNLCA